MNKTKKIIITVTAIILLGVIIATSVYIGIRIGINKTTEENTTEEASGTEVITEQEETATIAKEETTTVAETTTSRTITTTKKETIYQNYYSPTTTRPSIQREDEAVLDPDKEYDVYFDGEDYYYAERKTETSTQVIVIIGTSLVPIEPWQGEDNQQDLDGYVNSYEGEFN